MSTVGAKLKHEVKELIPVTLFFLVAFELLALTQAMMLEEYGQRVWTFAAAAIGSLVVAKVVVIADHFKFLNKFPERPLMYNVAWKTAIYFVASLAFHYAEHLVHAWRKAGSFAQANRVLFQEIHWPHLIVVQMWLLILLIVFCTMRELVRVLGRDKVARLFGQPGPAGG
jgi:hypothetical protein